MAEADTHTMPSRAERRLSAIFSTDVQGYSRLMGDDEEATIRTLTAYREVFSSLIQQHHGRVVDSPGDNLLAEFGSAVDAVRCGVAVQKELAERNSALPESRKMLFRIGLNVGDVIVEAERIYGDGVNIAARIEGLADGGGVCISGTVYDQVEGKLQLGYQDLGEQTVKNIAKPIRVYRVLMDPEMVGQTEAASAPAATAPEQPPALPDKPSIAVLPFLNLSGDPEQEYFSDGMTEDLITDLSKISSLFVISRNSVFLYKGSTVKPEEVCKELGVRYILEGSVRKAGNRVRITAQLIDATTGYHLWAERYDGQLDDIFALQDEVLQQIVAALAVKLTAGEQARVGSAPTQNLEAYDAFVRGREEYRRLVREANMQARQLFEQAIGLDPDYAEAYAFLGRTYLKEVVNQWNVDPSTIEKVFTYGQKAVELDESQPTAHETLAYALLAKKQYDEAISEARTALSYDPNFADAYVSLGEILSFAGQPAEAVPLIEQAMRLNPRYTPDYLWALGHAHKLLGNNEEAISLLKRVITRNPDHLVAHLMLAASYSETGQHAAAHAATKEILRINPNYSLAVAQGRMPYKDAEVIEHQLENLRKAGLE